jgi:hypothetical protein
VLETSSVAYQLSCFEVGFSLCWFTGCLFLCLTPFLWGRFSDLSAGALLSVCCDSLLIVFQFCRVVWLLIFITSSGEEFCRPLPALFQAATNHHPAISLLAFPPFVYWKFVQRSVPCFPLFSGVLSVSHLLFCVLVFSSLFVFFSFAWGSLCPGGYASLSQGLLGEYHMMLFTHLFALLNVSQAYLELVSGSNNSPLVFYL